MVLWAFSFKKKIQKKFKKKFKKNRKTEFVQNVIYIKRVKQHIVRLHVVLAEICLISYNSLMNFV